MPKKNPKTEVFDELFRRAPESAKKLLQEHREQKRKADRDAFKKRNPDQFKK